MIELIANPGINLHYAKQTINMVCRTSQHLDAAPVQQRSGIDVKSRNENGMRRVLTRLRIQQSPIAPHLLSNSRHCSTNKPLQAIPVVLHMYPLKD